tara:strand:+ start:910 stop:1800 length:891 start_codon:yes stop_codon:yes gene_type:complete
MSSDNILSVNRDGLPKEIEDALSDATDGSSVGIAGTSNVEPSVIFNPAQREKIITNDDSHIILGGDRISSKASGYGGKGHTHAHMIDLVVGRDPKLSGNPSFKGDAARIYISQRTDIDSAYDLAQGNVKSTKARSAIGLKADGIRIVAREGIKLVTMGKGTKNSLGKKIQTYTGIDLIAGNDDTDMEPLAKAYRVADTFEVVIKAIESLSNLVEHFIDAQSKFNREITTHTHVGNLGGPTSNSAELAPAGVEAGIRTQALAKTPMRGHRIKCVELRLNHLEPFSDKWIGSRYNYTN